MKRGTLYLRSEQRKFMLRLSDFLRYTFNPTLSLMMLVATSSGFGIMAVLLYQFQPLVAAVICCSYTTMFSMIMILSFLKWKRYKNFYRSVFAK